GWRFAPELWIAVRAATGAAGAAAGAQGAGVAAAGHRRLRRAPSRNTRQDPRRSDLTRWFDRNTPGPRPGARLQALRRLVVLPRAPFWPRHLVFRKRHDRRRQPRVGGNPPQADPNCPTHPVRPRPALYAP